MRPGAGPAAEPPSQLTRAGGGTPPAARRLTCGKRRAASASARRPRPHSLTRSVSRTGPAVLSGGAKRLESPEPIASTGQNSRSVFTRETKQARANFLLSESARRYVERNAVARLLRTECQAEWGRTTGDRHIPLQDRVSRKHHADSNAFASPRSDKVANCRRRNRRRALLKDQHEAQFGRLSRPRYD